MSSPFRFTDLLQQSALHRLVVACLLIAGLWLAILWAANLA
ncbi:hypothetical protein [Rhizobium halophytocola]|uniref:Uncharacterized protein n=1 Tax=Rhizobium halophytocola TaxID=735519 RepID=A0ABS4DX96_9HYPH|nr:hypothetical protein [Rhizobium halophytocola]MBP1850295.1 hypothetical protein [Rhizobium halophytocola]